MIQENKIPLIQTIKEKCRVCYSCVRECPAHAIRIEGGQAEVIVDRCIGCGNCVRVCTQKAKKVRNSTEEVEKLLASKKKTAAAIAPTFPAEFPDISYRKVAGMLRTLGFDHVVEVAFGADLVSQHYKDVVEQKDSHYIGSTCPAVVAYVEKYYPQLKENLMPISSPMVAAGKVIHEYYGSDVDIVFIGPCLAKKDESDRSDDITEAITFIELRNLFKKFDITPSEVESSDFDPPHPGKGALYPIGRGILQSAGIEENLMNTNIIATDGTKQFIQAIKDFSTEVENVKFLEVLSCNGCIMGPGMTSKLTQFNRRGYISNYTQYRYGNLDHKEWEEDVNRFKDIDFSREFVADDQRQSAPDRRELEPILIKMGKYEVEDELNCGACGYNTCVEHAVAIHRGLAENEMCLPYTIDTLKATTSELKNSYEDLMNAKKALIQSEKLASLGRLASGIAHEINNPLTGILTFSSLLLEDLEKSEYKDDIATIVDETKRCRDIVRGLLDFARETKSEKELLNINKIISETMTILRKHVNFQNITIKMNLDAAMPDSGMDKNQMRSVINNLAINAADAMPDDGVLSIISKFIDNEIIIEISDNGIGIDEETLNKIFDPFFTTKETGRGTGLGLAVIYGIVDRHRGKIEVASTINVGTTFTVKMPLYSMD